MTALMQFVQTDVGQVGSISNVGTMRLFPPTKGKGGGKMVVGDDSGVLNMFQYKKGQMTKIFSTPPQDFGVGEVCIEKKGVGAAKKDRIFFPTGITIHGVSKKGKEFFKFTTERASSIKNMSLAGVTLFTSGESFYNEYLDTKESAHFQAKDRINCMFVSGVEGGGAALVGPAPNPILGCRDRYIRLLNMGDLFYEGGVDGAVSAVSPYANKDLAQVMLGPSNKECLYATSKGIVGQMLFSDSAVRRGWVHSPPLSVTAAAAATNIMAVDLFGKGRQDLLVAREDGLMQIFSVDGRGVNELIFSRSVGESVSSVEIGKFRSEERKDILLATFSGRLIAFDPSPPEDLEPSPKKKDKKKLKDMKKLPPSAADGGAGAEGGGGASEPKKSVVSGFFSFVGGDKGGKSSSQQQQQQQQQEEKIAVEAKIKAVRNEIIKLKEERDEAKTKWKGMSTESIAVAARTKVKGALTISPLEGTLCVTLTSDSPLDMIALQSDISIALVDGGPSVPSISPPDPTNECGFLATLRLQEPLNRIEFRILIGEGQVGTLSVYAIPRIPPKTCQVLTFPLRPLALFEPIPENEIGSPPLNVLRISGQFSLLDMHSYLSVALPDIPERCGEKEMNLFTRSALLGTVLTCQYSAGTAVFQSDSPTPLAIVKDVVTKAATLAKQNVKFSFEFNEQCIPHFMKCVDPLLSEAKRIKEQVTLLDALKEVAAHPDTEPGVPLSTQDAETIQNAEQIVAKHKKQPFLLESLHGSVRNFYIEKNRFRGATVKSKLPELDKLLENYDAEAVQNMLAGTSR